MEYPVTISQCLGFNKTTYNDDVLIFIGSYRGAIPGYFEITTTSTNTPYGELLQIIGTGPSGNLPVNGSTIPSTCSFPFFVADRDPSSGNFAWTNDMLTTRTGVIAFRVTSLSLMNNRPGYIRVYYSKKYTPEYQIERHVGATPIGFHLSGSFHGDQYKKIPIVL